MAKYRSVFLYRVTSYLAIAIAIPVENLINLLTLAAARNVFDIFPCVYLLQMCCKNCQHLSDRTSDRSLRNSRPSALQL